MVRRMLVEAVADLLQINGKVYYGPHFYILIVEHRTQHGSRIGTNLVLQNYKLRTWYDDQPSL